MVSEVWDALGELVADGFKWKEYKKDTPIYTSCGDKWASLCVTLSDALPSFVLEQL